MSTAKPPFGVTVCGIDELEGHCATRATHVLSILDPDYPVPEAFGEYGEHERVELRFHDIIDRTPGMILPQPFHVEAVLRFGQDLLEEPHPPANLIVHCHAGISRSTASMSLILAQAMPDVPAERILGLVLSLRDKAWPNLRLIELGDAMLDRGGSLVDAAFALYRLQIERRPHIAAMMEEGGRLREVAGARHHAPLGN